MTSDFFSPSSFQNLSTRGQSMRIRQDMARLRQETLTAQAQLASGYKAETHGGLKAQATVAQGLRHRFARLDGYLQTTQMVGLRLKAVQQAMDGMREGVTAVRQAAVDAYAPGFPAAIETSRVTASSAVGGILALVNTSQGGRHLFSGTEVSVAPAVNSDVLLNGQGGRSGLASVIERRLTADLGAGNTGRLSTAVAAPVVTLTHDGGAFGLRPTAISGPGTAGPTATNATTTTATLDASAIANGQRVAMTFALPDGTTASIGLIATTTMPLPASPGQDIHYFQQGDANSLQTVLNGAITGVVNREMIGASAMAAGNDFFDHGVPLVHDEPAANATRRVMSSSSVVDWLNIQTPPLQVKAIASDPAALAPAPQTGDVYVVANAPPAAAGLWAGQEGRLATYNGVGWTFVEPEQGARVVPAPATAADTPRVFAFGAGNTWVDSGQAPEEVSARESVKGKIDDGLYVDHGARADEAGVRDSLKVAAVLAAAGYDPNNPAGFKMVAEKIASLATTAHDKALGLQAELGVVEERVYRIGETHKDFRALLNNQIVDVEGADQIEVTARLQDLMTRLEASFAIVARMQNMSLTNYL